MQSMFKGVSTLSAAKSRKVVFERLLEYAQLIVDQHSPNSKGLSVSTHFFSAIQSAIDREFSRLVCAMSSMSSSQKFLNSIELESSSSEVDDALTILMDGISYYSRLFGMSVVHLPGFQIKNLSPDSRDFSFITGTNPPSGGDATNSVVAMMSMAQLNYNRAYSQAIIAMSLSYAFSFASEVDSQNKDDFFELVNNKLSRVSQHLLAVSTLVVNLPQIPASVKKQAKLNLHMCCSRVLGSKDRYVELAVMHHLNVDSVIPNRSNAITEQKVRADLYSALDCLKE